MQYQKHLPVPGLLNCRDLGGFPAKNGTTRYGVFLRSEAPCDLGPEAVAFLREYGLTTTFDLRGEPEIQWRPSALAQEFDYRLLSLSGGAETFEKKNLPEGEFSWDKVYIKRAIAHRDWICRSITALTEAPGCSLFHCTTGKDRTGILTCCLLGAVGVSKEDIAADYCVSEVYLQPMFDAMRSGRLTIRKEPSHFEEYVFHTPYTAMMKFYEFFQQEFGSVRNYLLDIGVTEDTLQKLEDKLVER